MIIRAILIFLLILELGGCGFRLHQSSQLSKDYQPLYIRGLDPYSQLSRVIKDHLTSQRIETVSDKTQAKSILTITNLGESTQVLAVDRYGKASEYYLIRKIKIRLHDRATNKSLVDSHITGVRRNWSQSAGSGLSGQREREAFNREMIKELVESMFRTLSFALRK